jgi:hypothetical protein
MFCTVNTTRNNCDHHHSFICAVAMPFICWHTAWQLLMLIRKFVVTCHIYLLVCYAAIIENSYMTCLDRVLTYAVIQMKEMRRSLQNYSPWNSMSMKKALWCERNRKKIFEVAKKRNDESMTVDECFPSNAPIIRQSLFNKESIRLYSNLSALIRDRLTNKRSINPFSSPSINRIFYRCWAYLPLWIGILSNFEERYTNSAQVQVSLI